MSSILAMVLMAAMAVPGNGLEMVSAEMEERLDLSGEWEGTWWLPEGQVYPATMDNRLLFGDAFPPHEGAIFFRTPSFRDEGIGKFRIEPKDTNSRWLGIYEQHEGHLLLCFGEDGEQRPRSFRGGDGQHLLILHRVKSGR
jgi:hypothetical protein